jgi:hypothetical protein
MLALAACTNSEVKGKNGVVYKSALEYNDYIIKNQKEVINVVLDFVKVAETSIDSANTILDNGMITADEAVKNIEGMPPYKGDSTFRNAAINSFRFYRQVLGDEYKEMLAIRRKGQDMTSDDLNRVQVILDELGKREEKYDKAFHNAQVEFAKENNLRLSSNEMQEKIDKLKK